MPVVWPISRQSQEWNNAQFPALCLSIPLMNVQHFPVSIKECWGMYMGCIMSQK